MSANIGVLDRLARIAIGLVLIAYAIPVWFAPGKLELGGLDRCGAARHGHFRHLPDLQSFRAFNLSIEACGLMSRLQASAVALIAVLLAAGGLYYWRVAREIPVQIAALQTNVEIRVFGIGTVEAQVVSRVGFQIAGKVIAIEADQGDFIKAGTVLAKLDDEAQRAKLMKTAAAKRQAAANLVKVQAQQSRAEITYQQKKKVNARRQQLAARGNVSPETAEDAQAAEETAHSDIDVFAADVGVAGALQDDTSAQRRSDEVVLAQHELRAPFDARVIARHKELGSVVNAGEPVFTLIAPETIWVRALCRRSAGRRVVRRSNCLRAIAFGTRSAGRNRNRPHRPGERSRHRGTPHLCAMPGLRSKASTPLSR